MGESAREEFRNRIYWLTFLLSVLVVWIHSLNGELFLGTGPQAQGVERLEEAVAGALGQIAVPGFFVVSAYLFYRNFSWERLGEKWSSRARSVLAPYLLWNLLYYLGYLAATRIPVVSRLVGKEPLAFQFEDALRAVFLYAYNPVFWYLYQLILLVVLAPFLYSLLRRTWTGALTLVFIMWLVWANRDLPWLNEDALFYYAFGAFLALHRGGWAAFAEKRLDRPRTLVLAALLAAGFFLLWLLGRPGELLYGRALHTVLARLFGVCTAALLVKTLPLPPAREWMKQSFFLYAIHFAWVRLLNKTAARLLPPSPAAAFTLFFLMPAIMTVIAAVLGGLLRRIFPRAYALLSGGR